MSKYTTELRFICEGLAGETKSQGYTKVADIISAARPKIFSFDYPLFDANYKQVIETKILKHFYTREIGLETFGLWQLKLDTKMNEIMPYYNKLYESELLEFNPLYSKDLHRVYNKESVTDNDTSSNGVADGQISATRGETLNETQYDLYSETPQGSLSGVDNETYLTNARKATDAQSNTITNAQSSHDTNATTGTFDGTTTDEYSEHVYGYETGGASKLLKEFRETLLNIDMMIINDLEELFFGLW